MRFRVAVRHSRASGNLASLSRRLWMPDHVRHDESGTAWLQPNVKRSIGSGLINSSGARWGDSRGRRSPDSYGDDTQSASGCGGSFAARQTSARPSSGGDSAVRGARPESAAGSGCVYAGRSAQCHGPRGAGPADHCHRWGWAVVSRRARVAWTKGDFMWCSRRRVDGDRKTMAVCHRMSCVPLPLGRLPRPVRFFCHNEGGVNETLAQVYLPPVCVNPRPKLPRRSAARPFAPIAGSADGRSGRGETAPVSLSSGRRRAESTKSRSARRAPRTAAARARLPASAAWSAGLDPSAHYSSCSSSRRAISRSLSLLSPPLYLSRQVFETASRNYRKADQKQLNDNHAR